MVICDTLASSQCNTRSQQGAERGTGESRCAITTPTPPHTPTAETSRCYVTHLIEDGFGPEFVKLLLSPLEDVHDVRHALTASGNLRGGGGYLRPSITQMPRRFDACAAGVDARLVA